MAINQIEVAVVQFAQVKLVITLYRIEINSIMIPKFMLSKKVCVGLTYTLVNYTLVKKVWKQAVPND